MTVIDFYSLVQDTCNYITQKGIGNEMFTRPSSPPEGSKKIFIEKIISEKFFKYLDEKHPDRKCLSWLKSSLQSSDFELFWYPARNVDALISGDEQSTLFLEFKVFDKAHDGHKGCDVRNAFVQLLQYMMKDKHQNKEGAVVVFDIWQDNTKCRRFDARPHDREFVLEFQNISCVKNIHLIWIWFDRESKRVQCDLCSSEG